MHVVILIPEVMSYDKLNLLNELRKRDKMQD